MMNQQSIVIEAKEEPEIQYAVPSAAMMGEIRQWLHDRRQLAGQETAKDECEMDCAVYYDTRNMRLLREGMEYRVKQKGDSFRHDIKAPLNGARSVAPDRNGIIVRQETKFKTDDARPSLMSSWGQAMLQSVGRRVKDFFGKRLEAKFRTFLDKHKIDYSRADEDCKGRVEYSFQTGFIETMIGPVRRTAPLHILEIELRTGDQAALLAEKRALEEAFMPLGLKFLEKRKVLLGFELLVPDMDEKQIKNFQEVLDRLPKAGQPQTAPQEDYALAA
jgi:hypothetical protein